MRNHSYRVRTVAVNALSLSTALATSLSGSMWSNRTALHNGNAAMGDGLRGGRALAGNGMCVCVCLLTGGMGERCCAPSVDRIRECAAARVCGNTLHSATQHNKKHAPTYTKYIPMKYAYMFSSCRLLSLHILYTVHSRVMLTYRFTNIIRVVPV